MFHYMMILRHYMMKLSHYMIIMILCHYMMILCHYIMILFHYRLLLFQYMIFCLYYDTLSMWWYCVIIWWYFVIIWWSFVIIYSSWNVLLSLTVHSPCIRGAFNARSLSIHSLVFRVPLCSPFTKRSTFPHRAFSYRSQNVHRSLITYKAFSHFHSELQHGIIYTSII